MRPCSGGAAAPTPRRPLDAARPEATERRAFKPDRARARATNVGDERSYETKAALARLRPSDDAWKRRAEFRRPGTPALRLDKASTRHATETPRDGKPNFVAREIARRRRRPPHARELFDPNNLFEAAQRITVQLPAAETFRDAT